VLRGRQQLPDSLKYILQQPSAAACADLATSRPQTEQAVTVAPLQHHGCCVVSASAFSWRSGGGCSGAAPRTLDALCDWGGSTAVSASFWHYSVMTLIPSVTHPSLILGTLSPAVALPSTTVLSTAKTYSTADPLAHKQKICDVTAVVALPAVAAAARWPAAQLPMLTAAAVSSLIGHPSVSRHGTTQHNRGQNTVLRALRAEIAAACAALIASTVTSKPQTLMLLGKVLDTTRTHAFPGCPQAPGFEGDAAASVSSQRLPCPLQRSPLPWCGHA